MMTNSKIFYNADDLIEIFRCKKSTAYKIIRTLNQELAEQGYRTKMGRVSAKYVKERYGL